MSYVSSKDLKTECIKGYFKTDIAHEIRQLARKQGMTTSHFVRAIVHERVRKEQINSANNIYKLTDFKNK